MKGSAEAVGLHLLRGVEKKGEAKRGSSTFSSLLEEPAFDMMVQARL
jgi:hypothetical protein